MLSGIIHSINTRNVVPKQRVIVFDHNILQLAYMADRAIAWFYRQIERAFLARRDHLPIKAIPEWRLPNIIVVKPITRPTWTPDYQTESSMVAVTQNTVNTYVMKYAHLTGKVITDHTTNKLSILGESTVVSQGRIRGGAGPPQPPKMRPQHQNSTKLRPQNGSFRP